MTENHALAIYFAIILLLWTPIIIDTYKSEQRNKKRSK
jgi:hypothetical protein